MARRARKEIESNWDIPARTAKLVKAYRSALAAKRKSNLSAQNYAAGNGLACMRGSSLLARLE